MIGARYATPEKFPRNWGDLKESRHGIMLHYDASGSDDGAVEWLLFDRRCKVSYNWLILDDGTVRDICPPDKRAWHAGVCKPSDPRLAYKDANSAFYGIAVAAKPGDVATEKQFNAVVSLVYALVLRHTWKGELWRIVPHRTEAWPRGRKDDPDGKSGVVLSVDTVRAAIARMHP